MNNLIIKRMFKSDNFIFSFIKRYDILYTMRGV